MVEEEDTWVLHIFFKGNREAVGHINGPLGGATKKYAHDPVTWVKSALLDYQASLVAYVVGLPAQRHVACRHRRLGDTGAFFVIR